MDAIVRDGYKEAGYEYVVIDDCWLEHERDPQTQRLVPDRKRFPNGMKAVGDYVSGSYGRERRGTFTLKSPLSLDPLQGTQVRSLRRLRHQDLRWIPWSH